MSAEPTALWGVLLAYGAVAALDHAAWPSLLLSQPIVAGGIVGLVAGHPEAGLAAGAVAQLLWLAPTPVGGVAVPEAWLAGLATAWCAPADLPLADASWLSDPRLAAPAVVGVAAAHGGRWLLVAQRRLQRHWARGLESDLARGDARGIERLQHVGLALHALRGVLGTLGIILLGPPLAATLARIGIVAPAGWLAVAIGAVALASAAPRARRMLWLGTGALVGVLAAVLR